MKKMKNMKNTHKQKSKNIKQSHKISKKLSKYLTKSQNISQNLKISQTISKYLKISLMLFFKCGFAKLGSVLHIFLDHRKSQKISNYLKKSQNISNLLGKNKKTRKQQEKHDIKLTQPYNNFAEASGRIAAQLSAVIIFPCVVKC